MVCEKLSAGICEILKEYCEKPYELKMGIKLCPVLKGKIEKKEEKGRKKTKVKAKVKGKKAKGKKNKKKK
ncbi:MAG: hypothetical protein QXI58_07160 [Candidatus Micrarchaeia archaeon]